MLEQWINQVHEMDALELLAALPEHSIDAILTDLPYGQLDKGLGWDEVIPFEPMWAGVWRALKPGGVFATTASRLFAARLIMSQPDKFRYDWIWDKTRATGFLNANLRPLTAHEQILVFSEGGTIAGKNAAKIKARYFPQMGTGKAYSVKRDDSHKYNGYGNTPRIDTENNGTRYPTSVLRISSNTADAEHPTQKPTELYEYLIRTYTLPGEVVLDFCAGSGTTGIAARQTGRAFILGDTSPEYVALARRRLAEPYTVPMAGFE